MALELALERARRGRRHRAVVIRRRRRTELVDARLRGFQRNLDDRNTSFALAKSRVREQSTEIGKIVFPGCREDALNRVWADLTLRSGLSRENER